jgi:hypothetical protein
MILRERYVSGDEAAAAAQAYLTEHAWPQPVVAEIDTTQAPGLFVQALGYAATANFQYVDTTAADGTTGNISAFVQAIVANDCQFLTAGNIETNTLQRYRRFDDLTRCWDAIEKLAQMGDADGAPWIATVYNGRALHYERADNRPTLFWGGSERGVTAGAGRGNPWLMRPGVMRDLTGLVASGRPGAFLQQARDTWVDEVEMAQGQDKPQLRPGGYDPRAILAAQAQYLRWMEGMDEA